MEQNNFRLELRLKFPSFKMIILFSKFNFVLWKYLSSISAKIFHYFWVRWIRHVSFFIVEGTENRHNNFKKSAQSSYTDTFIFFLKYVSLSSKNSNLTKLLKKLLCCAEILEVRLEIFSWSERKVRKIPKRFFMSWNRWDIFAAWKRLQKFFRRILMLKIKIIITKKIIRKY